jgi:thymidine kinase
MANFHLIYGCMYSGKTTHLISHCDSKGEHIAIFKPITDDRSTPNYIETHFGDKMPCIDIESPESISDHISKGIKIIAIDEIQFFSSDIKSTIHSLLNRGIEIIAAGLYFDFKKVPFQHMPELKNMAHSFTELFASCEVCSLPANNTYRTIENEELILTGSTGIYQARCDSCFELKPVKARRGKRR